MEYRRVGSSGLVVSELSFGAATFGGSGDFFGAWGNTDVERSARESSTSVWTLVSRCSTPPTSTPTARSEEVLGAALRGRRDQLLISTKAALPTR